MDACRHLACLADLTCRAHPCVPCLPAPCQLGNLELTKNQQRLMAALKQGNAAMKEMQQVLGKGRVVARRPACPPAGSVGPEPQAATHWLVFPQLALEVRWRTPALRQRTPRVLSIQLWASGPGNWHLPSLHHLQASLHPTPPLARSSRALCCRPCRWRKWRSSCRTAPTPRNTSRAFGSCWVRWGCNTFIVPGPRN